MKILHTVQLYDPKVGGSEEVVKQLSERLAARGHDVTVATAAEPARKLKRINGVNVVEFDLSGNDVRGIVGDPESYVDYIVKGDFDVIMNYAAQIWSTDLVYPYLDQVRAKKVIVPCGYSGLRDPVYTEYFERMPSYLARYDKAIYMSPTYQDKLFADRHKLTNSVIIPNGADEREFTAQPIGFRKRYGIKTKFMLLCVSNHYNLKGHEMVLEAFRRLGRKDTTLVVIGNPVVAGRNRWRTECYRQCQLAAFGNRRIKMLADVPRPMVVSAYQEADLFVFGSQVEASPLVIFEAMAAGLPFISTDVGDIKDRAKFGRLIESPAEMTDTINELINHSEVRSKIGKMAHAEWKEKYSWEQITNRYEELYESLLKPS
ncbi:MAG: glycosyltransferase family 4 protein [Candidatus Saccharimonadia bacterium]